MGYYSLFIAFRINWILLTINKQIKIKNFTNYLLKITTLRLLTLSFFTHFQPQTLFLSSQLCIKPLISTILQTQHYNLIVTVSEYLLHSISVRMLLTIVPIQSLQLKFQRINLTTYLLAILCLLQFWRFHGTICYCMCLLTRNPSIKSVDNIRLKMHQLIKMQESKM